MEGKGACGFRRTRVVALSPQCPNQARHWALAFKIPHPIPQVAPGTWLRVGQTVDGYVLTVNSDGSLEVGYFQNRIKAIKETIVWNGDHWELKYTAQMVPTSAAQLKRS